MTEKNLALISNLVPHTPFNVVSQGAEALVLETCFHPYLANTSSHFYSSNRCIIKFRPPKPYRHPRIDASITKARTVGELKFMAKLYTLGIPCPAIILSDIPNGILWMEYRGSQLSNGEPSSLKNWLWQLERSSDAQECTSAKVKKVCTKVGEVIGRLHLNDMIHGDLTSSNILLEDESPILIDFGLSTYSSLAEDKAVDIYVLERAILSTHSMYAGEYTRWILQGYEQIHKSKSFSKRGTRAWTEVVTRLEEVRLRGRKRSMLG